MANKKTMKEYFGEIRAILENAGRADLVEFVDKRVEQLNKKAENKGLTATQKANEDIKAEIVKVLANAETKMKISEIQANSEMLKDLSNQKMSALLKQLVDTNVVIKEIEKKVAYFTLA